MENEEKFPFSLRLLTSVMFGKELVYPRSQRIYYCISGLSCLFSTEKRRNIH